MIPVFYNPMMVANVDSYSPSAGKPLAVINDWQRHFLYETTFVPSKQCSQDDLARAHSTAFVEDVLSGEIPNGFGTRDKALANSLRYTTGSMLSAATSIMEDHRMRVAVSPSSGFHHAGFDTARGYCTFNGLIVTAMKLRALNYVERVGILDMDQHYGDGTAELIERHQLDYITHVTAGAAYQRHSSLIDKLPGLMETWFADLAKSAGKGEAILLYQAGADCHVDDPLGGYLTTEEMAKRDRIVFQKCFDMHIPVVWNLAGGYQRDEHGGFDPVLKLHRRTMSECLGVFS